MDRSAIFAKTAKGLEEMKSRAHGLPQKFRSLLIVVDGTMSAGDLMGKLAAAADIEAGLRLLIEQGYIELASKSAAVQPAESPQAADPLGKIDLGGG